MRQQFVRQLLSAASLLVLFPTVLLVPYAVMGLLVGFAGSFGPGGGFAPSLLPLIWTGGYLLICIAYLLLLVPLPRLAGFVFWSFPVGYLLLMLVFQPWNTLSGMSGGGVDEGFANWAMSSLLILLPISLVGFWLERPGRKNLPPPYPA